MIAILNQLFSSRLLFSCTMAFICLSLSTSCPGQVQLGGPNGIVMGGGQGFRIGPPNAGIQFGGGQGARFGTPNAGIQFGGGEGARFGTRNAGMKFGGGEGARFGTPNYGLQFGNGEGVRVGSKSRPAIKIGGENSSQPTPAVAPAQQQHPALQQPTAHQHQRAQPQRFQRSPAPGHPDLVAPADPDRDDSRIQPLDRPESQQPRFRRFPQPENQPTGKTGSKPLKADSSSAESFRNASLQYARINLAGTFSVLE